MACRLVRWGSSVYVQKKSAVLGLEASFVSEVVIVAVEDIVVSVEASIKRSRVCVFVVGSLLSLNRSSTIWLTVRCGEHVFYTANPNR